MNVSLTRELEQFVEAKVDTGRYNSASEVVREALRMMEERDRSREAELAAFSTELDSRLRSLDQGKASSPARVRARLQEKSRRRQVSIG